MIKSFSGEYRFLSNFWPSPVQLDGLVYPTVEHAYQAAKTLVVRDREKIRALSTPGEAKRAGRNLQLRPSWDQVKIQIMTGLIAQKFAKGSVLGAKLAYTGSEPLEEGNTWGDRFWGTCGGTGRNELGKILMAQRSLIQSN